MVRQISWIKKGIKEHGVWEMHQKLAKTLCEDHMGFDYTQSFPNDDSKKAIYHSAYEFIDGGGAILLVEYIPGEEGCAHGSLDIIGSKELTDENSDLVLRVRKALRESGVNTSEIEEKTITNPYLK